MKKTLCLLILVILYILPLESFGDTYLKNSPKAINSKNVDQSMHINETNITIGEKEVSSVDEISIIAKPYKDKIEFRVLNKEKKHVDLSFTSILIRFSKPITLERMIPGITESKYSDIVEKSINDIVESPRLETHRYKCIKWGGVNPVHDLGTIYTSIDSDDAYTSWKNNIFELEFDNLGQFYRLYMQPPENINKHLKKILVCNQSYYFTDDKESIDTREMSILKFNLWEQLLGETMSFCVYHDDLGKKCFDFSINDMYKTTSVKKSEFDLNVSTINE